MRRSTLFRITVLWCACCLVQGAPPARAEEALEVKEELREMRGALEEMRRTLERQNETIERQQRRIDELEQKLSAPSATEPGYPPAGGWAKEVPGARQGERPPAPAAKALGLPGLVGSVLPEIGVVGDIVATSSEQGADGAGNDRVSVRALELILGSYVDPYSRMDATIHFSDSEAAEIDEAYLTRWGLPFELTGRLGRFFPKVGKAGAGHRDALSTVDMPLVIRRYFGSEGYFRTGADLSRVFEGPAGWVLEPSFGVLEGGLAGEGGNALGGPRRRPTIYSHLKTYKEFSDSSGLELGATHLVGSKDNDPQFEVNILGVDATYVNKPTPTTQLKLQSELFLQHRDESFSVNADTGGTTYFNRHPWGAYFVADYQFAPRWSVGGRVDHVRLAETGGRPYDQGFSAFLTFFQSEWARWRVQYRHEERGPEPTDDSVFLQGTFAIGTHKHKLQ